MFCKKYDDRETIYWAFQYDEGFQEAAIGPNSDEVVQAIYTMFSPASPENVVVNPDGSLSVDTADTPGTITVPVGPDGPVFVGEVGSPPFGGVDEYAIMSKNKFTNEYYVVDPEPIMDLQD